MFIKYLIPIYFLYLINIFIYAIKYKNNNISPKTFIKNSVIHKHVLICGWANINNCEIWEYSYISWSEAGWIQTRLLNVKIGKFCQIAHNVEIINDSHFANRISTYPFFSSQNSPFQNNSNKTDKLITETIIWNDVWICSNVKIIWNVKIWDGAIIAAGSIVVKDVEPYTIVWWVPTKVIKKRFSDDEIKKLLNLQWWNQDIEWIKKHLDFLTSNNMANFKNITKW